MRAITSNDASMDRRFNAEKSAVSMCWSACINQAPHQHAAVGLLPLLGAAPSRVLPLVGTFLLGMPAGMTCVDATEAALRCHFSSNETYLCSL